MPSLVIQKERAYFWALLLGAFVCPLLVFPLTLIALYQRKPWALYPLMMVFAIVLCSVPITDDAYNYYRVFVQSDSFSINALLENKRDILFYMLSYCCHKCHISYFTLRFCLVASSLSILAWLFNDICRRYPEIVAKKHYFFLSVGLFVLTIDFVGITNALRYSYATVLCILSLYFITQERITKGFLFLILAICMHFGAWLYTPPILIFFFSRKLDIPRGWRLVLLAISLLTGKFVFMFLYTHILPASFQIETYVSGYWANIMEYRNERGQIYFWLHHTFISYALILLFIIKKKVSFRFEKMTFGVLLTYMAYLSLPTLPGRFFALLKIFIVVSLIIQGARRKQYISYLRLWVLIGLMLLSQGLDGYRFRETLFLSDNLKFWALPATYLFDDYYTSEGYLFQNRNI